MSALPTFVLLCQAQAKCKALAWMLPRLAWPTWNSDINWVWL